MNVFCFVVVMTMIMLLVGILLVLTSINDYLREISWRTRCIVRQLDEEFK